MIRVLLVWIYVGVLSINAWRDWFTSACGLVLMVAAVQHPDMPRNIAGIQGLNPWNLLMLFTVVAWLMMRRRERLTWDMPRHVTGMLLVYLLVVLVAFARMIVDREPYLADESFPFLISEYVINAVKWVVPGLMLFDGCRNRRRLTLAVLCVLAVYFLLAVQVIRWMPLSSATSGFSLMLRSRKIISSEIGFHAVNMSMLLSGGSWAVLAATPLLRRRWQKLAAVGAFFVIALGQALTAGRMGYVTWGVVGLLLCFLRWRIYLWLLPLVPVLIMAVLPGTADRLLEGFGARDVHGEAIADDQQITSGRTEVWPLVLEKIVRSPAIGHGRLGMRRTGLANYILETKREGFDHPHNAYLEWILDNGLIGFVLVMPFYAMMVWYAVRLFRDRGDPACAAVGGVALALLLALLVAAMGSQTFYPREGAVGMWCAIMLMLRVYVQRFGVRAAVPGVRVAGVHPAGGQRPSGPSGGGGRP